MCEAVGGGGAAQPAQPRARDRVVVHLVRVRVRVRVRARVRVRVSVREQVIEWLRTQAKGMPMLYRVCATW